jgi:DNA-binding NarL/FixJ family response regulator
MNSRKPLAYHEYMTLTLLAQGRNDLEIAAMLGVEKRTVCGYVCKIRSKTGIHNRVLLAFYAYSKGYVTNSDIKEAIQLERRKKQ